MFTGRDGYINLDDWSQHTTRWEYLQFKIKIIKDIVALAEITDYQLIR